MSEVEELARTLHEAAVAPALQASAHVAGWDQLAPYFKACYTRQAHAVLAAGWVRETLQMVEQPVERFKTIEPVTGDLVSVTTLPSMDAEIHEWAIREQVK